MTNTTKEQAVAEKILDKYSRRLLVDALRKGYDLLELEFKYGPDNDRVKLSVNGYRENAVYEIETRRDGASSSIARDAGAFSAAKGLIGFLEGKIRSLSDAGMPVLSKDTLDALNAYSRKIPKDKEDDPYFILDNFTSNDHGETFVLRAGAGSKGFLKRLFDGTGVKDLADALEGPSPPPPADVARMFQCYGAAGFLRENTLVDRYLEETGRSVIYDLKLSLAEDIEELLPTEKDLVERFGEIKHLIKNEQIALLAQRAGIIDRLGPEYTDVDARVLLRLDEAVKERNGAIRSWDDVISYLRTACDDEDDPAASLQLTVPLAPSVSLKITTFADMWRKECMTPLRALSLLTAHKAGRTLDAAGVEFDADVVMSYIRGITRAVAERMINEFYASIGSERNVNLLEKMRNGGGKKGVAKKLDTAASMAAIAAALSSSLKGLYELAGRRSELIPVTGGWFVDVDNWYRAFGGLCYFGPKEAEGIMNNRDRPKPVLEIDMGTAASPPVMARKLNEWLKRYNERPVEEKGAPEAVKLLLEQRGEAFADILTKACDQHIRDIQEKERMKKDTYYDVMSRDFPEELMEEYAVGGITNGM